MKLLIFILFYILFTFSIVGYGMFLRKFVGQTVQIALAILVFMNFFLSHLFHIL